MLLYLLTEPPDSNALSKRMCCVTPFSESLPVAGSTPSACARPSANKTAGRWLEDVAAATDDEVAGGVSAVLSAAGALAPVAAASSSVPRNLSISAIVSRSPALSLPFFAAAAVRQASALRTLPKPARNGEEVGSSGASE